jgi:chloride channel protein, CIC family
VIPAPGKRKILATSLSLGIGGSGGVFAPSLFVGVTSGMAFGEIAGHVFGPAAGAPALYAVVAMGAVFTAAARAPLTSLASVVEMTGDFSLTLPVMLAVAIATAVSRGLGYGTIYTTKLLRRGIDIDRPAPPRLFDVLTVADTMHSLRAPLAVAPGANAAGHANGASRAGQTQRQTPAEPQDLPGTITHQADPQALYASESLAQALRQLEIYGRDGLPVISPDGQQVQGWITGTGVLRAVARRIRAEATEGRRGQLAAHWAQPDPESTLTTPPTPLDGYQVLEVTVPAHSPSAGQRLGYLSWLSGSTPVAVLHHRAVRHPDPGITLEPGDPITVLARKPQAEAQPATADR